MEDKSSAGSSGKSSKPVVRGKGKGKALNAIAAASGRDPAAIVKSVTEAEAAAKAAAAAEEARKAAEAQARAREKDEITVSQLYGSLSPHDQYRFECFRRCGFASKPMEKYVAKVLIEEAENRYLARTGAMTGLRGRWSGGFDDEIDNSLPTNSCSTAVADASDVDRSSKKLTASRKRKKPSKTHLLRKESKRREDVMDRSLPTFLGLGVSSKIGSYNSNGGDSEMGHIPPLDNLVVPNSASEIVAVVSTLAKCYGQRLVAAAKRVADAEEEEQRFNGTTDTAKTKMPLLPHHFLEAHRHRTRAGIDPGFWMAGRIEKAKLGSAFSKGRVGAAESAALGSLDRDKACYLAALAAQDAFDREGIEKSEPGNDCKMDNGSSTT